MRHFNKNNEKKIQILQQCSGVRPLICPNKKHVGTEIFSKIKYRRYGAHIKMLPITTYCPLNKR